LKRKGEFFMRRTWIDFDLVVSDLSDSAFRVLVYLLLHANKDGDCWPNHATIANETGRSERSVGLIIRELKSKKMLESFRDGNLGKGQIRYRINLTPSANSSAWSSDDQAQNPVDQAQNPADQAQPVAHGAEGPSAKFCKTKRKFRSDQAQNPVPPLQPPIYVNKGLNKG
jgi:hypothetical protein